MDKIEEWGKRRWERIEAAGEKNPGLKEAVNEVGAATERIIDEYYFKPLEKGMAKMAGWAEKEKKKSNLSPILFEIGNSFFTRPIGTDNPYWNTSKYKGYPNWYKEKIANELIAEKQEQEKKERKERYREYISRWYKALKGQSESKGSDVYKNRRASKTLEDFDLPVY